MNHHFKLDSLDKRILALLAENARIPYLEISRKCKVSGAAVHQRIQKMIEAEVISGSQFNINPKGLGFYTCAYIGLQVNLGQGITHEEVFEKIKKIPEIVECHHITGKYSLLVKIFAFNNEHLKKIIVSKIQAINEISSTETFLSLEEGFNRHLPIE